MKNLPLLLTGTIVPQTHELLRLVDKDIRYKQYANNLIDLIINSDFQQFVFCENSGSVFKDQKLLEDLCVYYKKEIEFLSFVGNQNLIEQFTRAYGDQEIMEYAVDNSVILKKFDGFYKLTGRYKVKNMNTILKTWENKTVVFVKGGLGKNTVHTCFFKTTKSYFLSHFYGKGLQLNQRYATKSLERLYYYYIKQSGVNMTINGIYPQFSGERGAGGMMDESFLMSIKTKIFAKLGVYDIKTTPVIVKRLNNSEVCL